MIMHVLEGGVTVAHVVDKVIHFILQMEGEAWAV